MRKVFVGALHATPVQEKRVPAKASPVLLAALFALSALAVNAQTGAAKKTRVAVFPFEVTANVVNADEAVFIREDFSNRLAETGLFELVPRTEVDKLFKQEAAFQLNDLSDASKTAEYGRVLNADWIMAGRLGKVGSRLALVVTMYTYPDFVQKPGSQVYAPDIDTLVDNLPVMIARIQAAHGGGAAPTTGQSGVAVLAPGGGQSSAAQNSTSGGGAAAVPTAPAPAKPATPAPVPAAPAQSAKTYKIGDTGPGGGVVFYDKGSYSDGWRYMEVEETPIGKAEWGASGKSIPGTGTAIGTGKKNTQIIVDFLSRPAIKESGKAAQRCAAYRGGGLSDWFLPSKDELNAVYDNYVKPLIDSYMLASNDPWLETFWSSSESITYTAWYQRFSDGNQDANDKYGTRSVCAVRAF